MSEAFIITGVAGFIGSHLARALLDTGHDVVGVDNFDPFYDRGLKTLNLATLEHSRFEFVEADIRDSRAMNDLFARARPASVIHLAALAGVRPSIAEPARYASVNLDGLVSVLDAARTVDCRRMVFASSSSVYGNNTKVPFAEDDPVEEPISPYAATKRSGELICHTYHHLFDMSVACLRFFTVFGPAQRPDLAIGKFMSRIAAGEPIQMFGDGATSRDYTYIDDIVGGILATCRYLDAAAAAASPRFRIFNLGNAHPIPLDDMIDAIAQVVGREPRIEHQPMQPGDVRQTWADLTRSGEELGYEPRTSFREGLERQWSWLRELNIAPTRT